MTAVYAVLTIADSEGAGLGLDPPIATWLDSGPTDSKEAGRLENDPLEASAAARLAMGTINSGKRNKESKLLQRLRIALGAPKLPLVELR